MTLPAEPPPLANSLGDARVDDLVRGVLHLCCTLLGRDLVAGYVHGSYADRSAVNASDIDIVAVVSGELSTRGTERLEAMDWSLWLIAPLPVDLLVFDEVGWTTHPYEPLRGAGILVQGRDIRDAMPPFDLDAYIRARMYDGFYFITRNRKGASSPLIRPLTAPEPDLPYLGYERRSMRLPDGREVPTSKELVVLAGWMATALVALHSGEVIRQKDDCVRAYARTIGDDWGPFLERIHQRCRRDWSYRLPERAAERAELAELAAQTLAFENHFLGHLADFLLSELDRADPTARMRALETMTEINLVDARLTRKLAMLEGSGEGNVDALRRARAVQATRV